MAQSVDPALVKVLFLVRRLGYGGAERQLVILARGLRRRGVDASVAVFYPGGPLEAELRAAGVPVHGLGKRHRWDLIGTWREIDRLVRRERPAIVHGYLHVPNLLLALRKVRDTSTRIVWGVRASGLDPSRYDWTVGAILRACRMLARVPDLIIVNSRAGREHWVGQGFPDARTTFVPNGIDTERFDLSGPETRAAVRAELGLSTDATVLAAVGRLDPMKDHETLLRAFAAAAVNRPAMRLVCIGDGHPTRLDALRALARTLGVADRVAWMGGRGDVERLYAGFDLLVSASAYGEGFSNVLAEAMASGVPCVATDVGDAREIVGELGRVVPPRDPGALASAIVEVLGARPAAERLRAQIVHAFGVEALVARTLRLLGPLAEGRTPS
jgi:glycosyltransferase involved in cell wall biosynthesis